MSQARFNGFKNVFSKTDNTNNEETKTMANATTTNNKKPAPAQPPHVKPAAQPKPAPKKDDDDIDLDGDGSKTKLPLAKRRAVYVNRVLARVTRIHKEMESWQGDEATQARTGLMSAIGGLQTAHKALESLPDNYQPRARGEGSTSKVELKPGDKLRITDKRKPEYDGVLSEADMVGIELVEVRGNKVICKTKSDGMKAMFPRGHVQLDA